jgi:hypothetical protein
MGPAYRTTGQQAMGGMPYQGLMNAGPVQGLGGNAGGGMGPTGFENFSHGAQLGAGLGGMLAPMFGTMGNPMQAANPYMQQANDYLGKTPDYVHQYLDPYVNAGQGAMGTLQGQYQNLMNDPNSMLAKMGAGYQQSPGYQHNVKAATNALNNAAEAGGYVGSPQHQTRAAETIEGLASQDYNQYLNNVMGLYGQGLQGMGGINQMGYGAASGATNTLADMLKNQAQNAQAQAELAYANQFHENQQQGGMFSGLGGLLGGALGSFGGPLGTAAGSWLGSKIGG